jgi:hypothetical protein
MPQPHAPPALAPGRAYWNAQNESTHTTPDWKIHFSCDLDAIGPAWDAIAALFMECHAEVGMKATVLGPDEWSDRQRGRELTVCESRFRAL